MQKEKPKSLESQLQMARPRRHEIKRVPLTPEEKEFLGKIMDKAVAAERAGRLQEAINFYTDYKNELLRIKKEREANISNRQQLIDWVVKEKGFDRKWAEKYIETNFDLSKLPKLETAGFLDFSDMEINEFPANMRVNGNLGLQNSHIKKWIGTGLIIPASWNDLYLGNAKVDCLPESTYVGRDLELSGSSIKDLPDNLYVGGNINIADCKHERTLLKRARKLKDEGKIKGNIFTTL